MTHIPVVVGAAQFTQDRDEDHPLDPMGLMEKTSAEALGQGGRNAASLVDAVWVSNILSWGYKDAPGLLARRLGITPRDTHYAIMSGHIPQHFVNRAAGAIARGELRAVLLAGAEAQNAAKRAFKGLIKTGWPGRENPGTIGDGQASDLGVNSLENRHQLMIPRNMYALFESAVRARKGTPPKEHMAFMGRLFERFSRIAANHPNSWMRQSCSAEEIATPGPDNPVACHPYTRRMSANMNVDMSAALVLTSEENARKLGCPPESWVHPMGGASLENIYYTTQRPRLDDSPALRRAARLALEQSGLTLDGVEAFDLYSCFPSMVEIALDELGLSWDDPRPLTVTGGLPFFGGPMGNYSMHAIVTVVEKIRGREISSALVTANGGFNTRHAAGVYGTRPGVQPWGVRDDSPAQEEIRAAALPPPVDRAQGEILVEGGIIRMGRDGSPENGVVLGRLENGVKTLAALDGGPQTLAHFTDHEIAGRTGEVRFDPTQGCNLAVISHS